MTTTVNVAFDPAALPAWAQRNPAVVARCKTDLPYRCNVSASQNTLAAQAAGEGRQGHHGW